MAKATDETTRLEHRRSRKQSSDLPRWGRWGLILFVSVVLVVSGFLAWRIIPGWRDRQEAIRLVGQGRYAEAEPLLRRALERDANDLEVVQALALGQLETNRPGEAAPYFKHWCALRPDDPEPFRRRMDMWLRQGWLPQALADGRRVLELEPDNHAVRKNVAHWSLVTAHYEEAERECLQCLAREPDNPELLYLLANIYHRQGRGAEAESILDPLVRDYPRFSGALVLRAMRYVEMDQPDKAIPLLRQALALGESRQQKVALYQLSLSLTRTGQIEEARQAMAEMRCLDAMEVWAKEGYPDNPAMQVQVAEAFLTAAKPEEALPLLDKVLAQNANYAAAHRLLASYYESQGQGEKAAEHRQRAGP